MRAAPLRLEPRAEPPTALRQVVLVVAGAALAFALGAAILLAADHDPVDSYRALLRGGFGSWRAWQATLAKSVPIGLCALGIALAARAGLWNIGAEGQLVMGAFAATGLGLALPPGTPGVIALPALFLAGALAGAVWAGLAATARAFLGVNEIISTLLLNYVAILWVDYLVYGPWADPTTFSFPFSRPLPANFRLPVLNGELHAGLLLLVAAGLGLAVMDRGMRWAYELRVAGDSPRAARYGGISLASTIVTSLMVGGALAGLAGVVEVTGVTGRLQHGLSPGYGFIGILVAWLAHGRAIAIVITAVLYAGLLIGGFSIQVSGVPAAIGGILQALLLVSVLGAEALGRYRIRVVPRTPAAAKALA